MSRKKKNSFIKLLNIEHRCQRDTIEFILIFFFLFYLDRSTVIIFMYTLFVIARERDSIKLSAINLRKIFAVKDFVFAFIRETFTRLLAWNWLVRFATSSVISISDGELNSLCTVSGTATNASVVNKQWTLHPL